MIQSSRASTLRAHREPRSPGVDPAELGMWFFLATVTMLFAAFVSSYLIRRTSGDWEPIALPFTLWLSSAALVASSGVLMSCRKAVEEADRAAGRRRLAGAIVLGVLFVIGQVFVWRQLTGEGVFLPTSPHASFFYLLTGLHVLHVTAGLVLMMSVRSRLGRPTTSDDTARRLIRISGSFWHYMAGLWIFLFLVLARL